jgi:hypothetical protein
MANWFIILLPILWSSSNFVVIWYTYFSPVWYIVPRKIWQPWSESFPPFFFQYVTPPFSFGVGVAAGTSAAASGRVNFDAVDERRFLLADSPGV